MSEGRTFTPLAGIWPQIPADLPQFRARFPIFKHSIHLASNSMGAVSDAFIAAQAQYVEERVQHGATWQLAMPRHEELRAAFADLIGASTREIAICFSATQALGTLASCLDWEERPVIVFDDYSFPSITYLWHAQTRRGARIRRVGPGADGLISPDRFDRVLDDQVGIVSVAHVCYKNGHRLDVPEVARRAHDAGALLVVDDYQSCGSRELNVRKAGIDVLVAGPVKFMLGSPGVAFMYVREELLGQLHPTTTGWFGQADPNNFQIETHIEASDATRFQSGTPAFSAVYDALAGIRLIQSVGLRRIGQWIGQLTQFLIIELEARGYQLATPREPIHRGPQVSIRSRDAKKAVIELARRGIICSSREGNIRTAWHFYNTPEDVVALIAALDELGELMIRSLPRREIR